MTYGLILGALLLAPLSGQQDPTTASSDPKPSEAKVASTGADAATGAESNASSPTLSATAEEAGVGSPQCWEWAESVGLEVAPPECLTVFGKTAEDSAYIGQFSEVVSKHDENLVDSMVGGRGRHVLEIPQVAKNWELRWESKGRARINLIGDDDKVLSKVLDAEESSTDAKKIRRGGKVRVEIEAGGTWQVDVVEFVKNKTYHYDVTVNMTVENPYAFPIEVDVAIPGQLNQTQRIPAGMKAMFSAPSNLGPYPSRQRKTALADEVKEIQVVRVLNVSGIAEKARADAVAKVEEDARVLEEQRLVAERQMDEFRENEKMLENDRASQRDAERLAALEETRSTRVRRRRIAGAGTLGGGLVGSLVLISTGMVKRAEAKAELRAPSVGFMENTQLEVLRQRADIKTAAANKFIYGGLATLSVAIAGSATFFTFAKKERLRQIGQSDANSTKASVAKETSKSGEAASFGVFPVVAPSGAGLGLTGRF